MSHRPVLVLDTETYPNCFLLCAELVDSDLKFTYELSERKDDSEALFHFLNYLRNTNGRAIGFNILGFDGPIIHMFMLMGGKATPKNLYDKSQAIINSQDDDKWLHYVKPQDRPFQWIDLYRIHHFNNKARATSLKMLQFTMGMDNIEDLPFPVGSVLLPEQIDELITYCQHDVYATKLFYQKSLDMIKFREELSLKYNRDMMNHDDVKIGSTIFEIALENSGVELYQYKDNARVPRQTHRSQIALKDCIPPWVSFTNEEFNKVHRWLKEQVITETKGVFTDLKANVDGLEFFFGTGGLHASLENKIIRSDDEYVIKDVDCVSMYPSIAIVNEYFPEHLGKEFVSVYRSLKEERIKYKKGTPENAALKLALNGTYGKSNDIFSVFFDPKFTMSVTLTGQMVLSMLADRLLAVPGLKICQANTDGITCLVPRSQLTYFDVICKKWEVITGMELEQLDYDFIALANVNNYIAKSSSGFIKRKGCYEYKMGWHQNHSALVVPKVAEKVLIDQAPIRETLEKWDNFSDFLLRTKVPRAGYLSIEREGKLSQLQNITRYYISKQGGRLFKWLPPLKDKKEWRKISIEAGWNVHVCNDINEAGKAPVDYDWYVREVEKIVNPLIKG